MIWTAVLVASVISFLLKFAGYSIPMYWLERPAVARITGLLPICLLTALVVTQTFSNSRHLHLDARAIALAVAALALTRRVPFLVVVALAAVTAALLRYAGVS